MNLDRRSFLGAAALGLAGLPRDARAGAADGGPRPCPPSSWTKGPVVLGGTPAERWVQNFTSPAEPLEGGSWRVWYSINGPRGEQSIGYAVGVPGGAMERQPAVLSPGDPPDAKLAVGGVPEGWSLVQPVHLGLPGGRHRLYFWARGDGAHRYLAAESDDGRRYRVVDPHRPCLYHPYDRAVVADSAEGAGLVRRAEKAPRRPPADEPPARAGVVSNDATNVDVLPDGTFEMYSVGLVEVPEGDPRYAAHDNAAGLLRVIDRRTSRDGLNWSDGLRVLQPDARDPADQQFYYLAVTRTERGRVGMLGHYRVGAQTMDLEWCVSADGISWDRPARRAWLERGRPGEPDSYGLYAGHNLVPHDGRWWLFYTGVNDAHNGRDAHGKPASVVRVATCPSIWA